MWTDALVLALAVTDAAAAAGGHGRGLRPVWIFDDFEFMLLIGVEEAIERCGREEERFGDQSGEFSGEGGHVRDVAFEGGAEVREEGSARPLVWGEEVVVAWGGGCEGVGVWGGEVDLFAPVGGVGGRFVAEFAVACWG